MTLNQFVADRKRAIFDRLTKKLMPEEGVFDEALLREGFAKASPQMGTARFEPHKIHLEFVFPDPGGAAIVVTVTLDPPERIVFLPVPEWVIESIWQGEVSGSFHFETAARALAAHFIAEIEPADNAKWFLPQPAKRRE
ncbi:MAG TPA: hypothetical protein PLH94_02515 [Fimbriimonadaceae bacterium]|nr:hypothetical protein [Fimbriimonadaceae bacterium]